MRLCATETAAVRYAKIYFPFTISISFVCWYLDNQFMSFICCITPKCGFLRNYLKRNYSEWNSFKYCTFRVCVVLYVYTVVWHTMNEWSRKKRIGEKRFGCRLMESVDNRPINRHQTVAICVSLIMENTKLNRAKFERYLTQYSVLCNKSA